MPNIAVINASTILKDSEVKAAVPALQTQVRRDFRAAWGLDADLTFVPKRSRPAKGSWWITILDNSDAAGALGYHDLTSEGLPLGKVFAASDRQDGLNWTITASHELLEMLADPDINLGAYVDRPGGDITLYAYEVCDACEADEFGYAINGTRVSDFVFPEWFESFRKPGSVRFDRRGKIRKPFQLLPGGYIGVYDTRSGRGWTQLTAAGGKRNRYALRPAVGTRRERRRTPRDQWVRSAPGTARP